MALLNDSEKEELLNLAKSSSLKKDMRRLLENRHNPVVVNGNVYMNRLITFLTEFNEFINHEPKTLQTDNR